MEVILVVENLVVMVMVALLETTGGVLNTLVVAEVMWGIYPVLLVTRI